LSYGLLPADQLHVLLLLQVKKVTLHDVRRMGEKAPTVSAA
jgi:hypothetical protein